MQPNIQLGTGGSSNSSAAPGAVQEQQYGASMITESHSGAHCSEMQEIQRDKLKEPCRAEDLPQHTVGAYEAKIRTTPEPKSDYGGGLAQVQHVVLVLSGKGGVGKSTMTTELALALLHAGKKVGILDVDLCGPSIPRMLSVGRPEVHQCDSGWVPVYTDASKSLALMSIGFLLENPDDAVVWRGPKKTALIGQFVSDVAWGELDYLLVDTPPGTSDEHLAVVENLRKHKVDGAILVTTPQVLQAVSTGDVRREITFCKKIGLRILGIVENMSGFVCPHCSIFEFAAQLLKHTMPVDLSDVEPEVHCVFCCVPLDPQLSTSVEQGEDFIKAFPESATFSAISNIAQAVLTSIENA
ncbi:hypothetical protein JZ751_026266 [Albula glossodonta]|uniref:Cytosolic Fe-S cluster assembly factor NUBP2 homolog n=1 Tax=Albula glossodonta TaxID=121402 RepID=A0A8T2P8Z3_9TELE|nr:hypothetical protein JZ751_026266 [Albula glossodonta]